MALELDILPIITPRIDFTNLSGHLDIEIKWEWTDSAKFLTGILPGRTPNAALPKAYKELELLSYAFIATISNSVRDAICLKSDLHLHLLGGKTIVSGTLLQWKFAIERNLILESHRDVLIFYSNILAYFDSFGLQALFTNRCPQPDGITCFKQ